MSSTIKRLALHFHVESVYKINLRGVNVSNLGWAYMISKNKCTDLVTVNINFLR